MSNAAKLKKKAVEFEQKKQYDKALALYVQVLDESAAGDSEPEVGLYNRVGDLLLRLGNTGEAITYYRKAVDLYADGGFLNNAIALCNKILRHDPGQTAVHYTLGRISAQKGFRSDAKVHFLEYAQRMQRGGELDESFRALKEFADLCPDQDDIRLMLAEQLSRQGRSAEAVEQLQTLHEKLSGEGRTIEARATAERMAAIDPEAAPRTGTGSAVPKAAGGLVFLDVSWEEPRSGQAQTLPPAPAAPQVVEATDPPAPAEPDLPAFPEPDLPTLAELDSPAGSPADGPVESILDEVVSSSLFAVASEEPVAGLEATALELDEPVEAPTLSLDVQPAQNDDFGLRDFAPLPDLELRSAAELSLVFPDVVEPPSDDELEESGSVGPELTFIMPDYADEPEPASAPARADELPLDLPLMDELAVPAPVLDLPIGNDAASETFVNLGDWLRSDEPPKSTRMVIDAVEPGEGEEFDFDDMLRKFKRGVAENLDEDDHESHYDLGVAFREMGLVNEAISEFQKALRGHAQRVRTYEALGQCFVDKGLHQVAVGVLARAISESPPDDQLLVGVLYLLAVSSEAVGRTGEAIAYYQRVFAVDINFRDVDDRLSALERTNR